MFRKIKLKTVIKLVPLIMLFTLLYLNSRLQDNAMYERSRDINMRKIKITNNGLGQQQFNDYIFNDKYLKDGELLGDTKQDTKTKNEFSTACLPQRHIYYLKVHKTGSTTMTCILFKYGVRHNLTFSLFQHHHPFPDKEISKYLRPLPGENGTIIKRDLMNFHSVFNQENIYKFMHKDTIFIATVRHPLSHLRSAFNYYKLSERLGMPPSDNELELFLSDPRRFDKLLPASMYNPIAEGQPLVSFTKNRMAFEFGFDLTRAYEDADYAHEYANYLQSVFGHVIIMEHYTESLIILRNKLCWEFQDILYLPQNHRKYSSNLKPVQPYGSMYESHRRWAYIDYLLYEIFLRKHKQEVQEMGQILQREVKHFNYVMQQMRPFCLEICLEVRSPWFSYQIMFSDFVRLKQLINLFITVEESEFHQEFKVTGEDCMALFAGQDFYYENLLTYHYRQENRSSMRNYWFMYGSFPPNVTFGMCTKTADMTYEQYIRSCCKEFF